jgi:protein gp37
MSKDTAIQWCDSTVNPTMGCDGCELWSATRRSCYAGVLHERYGRTNKGYAPTFEQVTKFPGRMAVAAKWSDLRGTNRAEKPWLNGLPRLIFVSDMSDALSGAVDFEYLKAEIVDVVTSEAGRRHQWLWLTKRPSRMRQFEFWLAMERQCFWPANLWAMTSITAQPNAMRAGILEDIGPKGTIRGLSIEPIHAPVDVRQYLATGKIHWVIVGGESGDNARPCPIELIEMIVRDCAEFKVACFVKQLGARPAAHWLPHGGGLRCLVDGHGGDWGEWPEHLRVRQFPEVAK